MEMRTENPAYTAVSGGYLRKCPECGYRQFSLYDHELFGVHICQRDGEHVIVQWVGSEQHGVKTSPPSAGHLAVLAKKAALKDKRR